MARLRLLHNKSPSIDLTFPATVADDVDMSEALDPRRPEENPLLKDLGITPSFADEESAPPVDLERLRRFYRGELDPESNQQVCDCIATFRSWYTAFAELDDADRETGS